MHRVVLVLILAAAFGLRLWNIDYGLPFVYSIDEASHFTSRAVGMFWQDLDPGYYQNPAAFTYLTYGLLRGMYGPLGFLFDLPYGNVTAQFAKDPTEIWIAARVLAAALGVAGAGAIYWAARRLWGVREGLVAAAVLSFAFLPVAYSRVAIAALVGAALELLRNPMRCLMLVSVPLVLFVSLSLQSRYFGRWLLPAYPALAMLASVAITTAADLFSDWIARRRGLYVRAPRYVRPGAVWRPRPLAARPALASGLLLALITGLVLAQPLAADVRTALVLGRADTREEARRFLTERFPPELRISIEPAVPGRYFRSNPEGRLPDWLSRCPARRDWNEPGWSYVAEAGRRLCVRFKPGQFTRPDGGVRASAYHTVLSPDVIDDYRFYGYCLVMTTGVVRERALETGDPGARAYYRRLERESRLLREFSPYKPGEGPVPFSFDLSYNYYPTAYHRPGPTVRIYRLNRCEQRSGPPVIQIPRAKEPPPFTPSGGARDVPREET